MASLSFTAGTSMDVPQTQNTAPVLEFRCLYTQDLRRKQKRWQDGRLKFHTFNKRVMVYDERSNFVGDTHWREDTAFDEGEELELERGGIMVEVGECVGMREQDLSELVDKRVKDREGRAAAKIAASSPSRPHVSLIRTSQATPGPLQHKPLNALLTTTGHYGRAVIPYTSPYEEKERLINGNQDGTENGRALKRRKPNEGAPSQSGYAQSLMGATLSLASLRPLSTATIRYEPVRAKPSVRDPPPPTIDLTSDRDEDEERCIGISRARVKEGRVSNDFRGKGQRRLKRSPSRSGYASNLTGTSLTLFRPEDLSARRCDKNLPVGIPAQSIRQGDNDSSSDAEKDSFIDTESVATELPAVIKPFKERPRKLDKSPKTSSTFDLGSSSPTLLNDATPTMKTPKTSTRKQVKPGKGLATSYDRSSSLTMVELQLPKPTKNFRKPPVQRSSAPISTPNPIENFQKPPLQNSSAVVPTLEQFASVLRIKARPPRKMMMLMDRPSSRSSGTTEASSASRRKPKLPRNLNQASNEVVLSQATMHLDEFCQRQEDIIQARLNGKRPAPEAEDLLSSPEDSGINHQTIDLLLSRKNVPSVNKTAAEPRPSILTSRDTNPGAQIERPCSEKEHNVEGVLKSQPKDASNLRSNRPNNGWRIDELDCPGDQNLLPEFFPNSGGETSTPCDSALQNTPTAVPMSLVAIVVGKEKEERTFTRVSQAPPTMLKLPEHFSSAMQAATDHFQAIIKCSASSEIQLPASTSSASEEKDEAEQTLSVPLSHQKEQTASFEIAVKPSPRSSLVGGASNFGTELLQTGSDLAKGSGESSEKGVSPAANGKVDTPKARLVNPATRGKSLQTIAANTVDSLAPAFSLMPPPAPPPPQRITTRPQRNVVAEERPPPGGYVGGRTIAGPWSRESYDLFGSWLPPGGLANVAQANTG
jgi:hypothetical protein